MGVVVSVHLTGRQFEELLRYTMTMLNAVTAEECRVPFIMCDHGARDWVSRWHHIFPRAYLRQAYR